MKTEDADMVQESGLDGEDACRDEVVDDDLIELVETKEKQLRECLNSKRRRFQFLRFSSSQDLHPIGTLHLEQIASHLHTILFCLKSPNNRLAGDKVGQASLRSLLNDIEDSPSNLSQESAWELAGEFERQIIELGDDTYLYTLLKAQAGSADRDRITQDKHVPTIDDWDNHFKVEDLTELCESYGEQGTFNCKHTGHKVRHFLRHLHLTRSEELRRDRAKISLRVRYLYRMTPLLAVLVILFCGFYVLVSYPELYDGSAAPNTQTPTRDWLVLAVLLSFVLISGAVGSVLSRAYRLGRQSVRVHVETNSIEPSLGIRELLAEGRTILAQATIGAAAAVIVYLVLRFSGVPLEPISYGVLGFLAGFSEPFFARILEGTAGYTQR
jgi:hypothetical protein